MNVKIALLKYLDRVYGGMVVRLLSRPRPHRQQVPRSFLIIRPGGIGDAVHIVPLLQRLHVEFPAAQLTLLAEKRNAGVMVLSPVAVTVLCYDCPGEFIQALFGHYDVVIDSEQWHRFSAIVARLVRAPVKIGFASNDRQRLFTDPIPYTQENYEATTFLSLLTPLAISPSLPLLPWLRLPAKTAPEISSLMATLHGRYVVLFPGASIAERRWGEDRFRFLAQAIGKMGWQVVVVGSRDDCAAAAAICLGGVGHDFSGKTTLAETAALIADADLLVSGDSGVLHLGVALGISTVSLFGSGIAEKWAPRGDRHRVLQLHLPCSPCTSFGTTPICTNHVACLTGISVDTVSNAVKKLLQQNGMNR